MINQGPLNVKELLFKIPKKHFKYSNYHAYQPQFLILFSILLILTFFFLFSLPSDSECIIELNRDYLSRPHGLMNQFLLLSTISYDYKSHECLFRVPQFRVYIETQQISHYIGISELLDTSRSNFYYTGGVELSEYIEYSVPGKGVIKTTELYDNSMWRWYFFSIMLRDKYIMSFVVNEIRFNGGIVGLYESWVRVDLSNSLCVHLRYPSHCKVTAERYMFGGWFSNNYFICNPNFEQYKMNINELRNKYNNIDRIVFITTDPKNNITINLVNEFISIVDVVLSDDLFVGFEQERYKRDLLDFLIMNNSFAQLSTFISTFALVSANMRKFRNVHYVKSFGHTFSQNYPLVGIKKERYIILVIELAILLLLISCKVTPKCLWCQRRLNKRRLLKLLILFTIALFVLPYCIEFIYIICKAVYLVEYKRLYNTILL